jgi:hypothetical protein
MGTIGVHCADPRSRLWFYVEFPFAKGLLYPDFRIDGRDEKSNERLRLGYPWDGLTEIGKPITSRILAIGGRKVIVLAAFPTYFSVEVTKERHWKSVLPKVVKAIREESHDPEATVISHGDSRGSYMTTKLWLEPLLEQLFG